jgi:glycerophosphoryl diester phosphodiesterase
MHKISIAFVTFASLTGMVLGQVNTPPAPPAAPPTVMVIAHRGEHLKHPENTLPAIQAAIDAGADYFELDVRTTADGKLVIMHDDKVNRTTNGTGEVSDLTLAQIRSLDAGIKSSPEFAGTKVPTFDEALELAHGKINIYVDTKKADPQLLVDTIVRHNMQDHVAVFGNPFFLYDIHKIDPTMKVMPEAQNADVCNLVARALQPSLMAFDAGDFKPDVIACAKKAKALVFVDRLGTADTPEQWQAAIDIGANAIQTNLPAELVAYLRSHGLHR